MDRTSKGIVPLITVYNNKRKKLVDQCYDSLKTVDPGCNIFFYGEEDTVGDDKNYIKIRNRLMETTKPTPWKYLCYIDDDLFFHKENWLRKMIQTLEDNPDVWQVSAFTWPSHLKIEKRKDITITNINSGGCLLMNRKAYEAAMPWQEDKDKTRIWCKKIQDAGGKIAFMNNQDLVIHCGIKGLLPTKRPYETMKRMYDHAKRFNAITNWKP